MIAHLQIIPIPAFKDNYIWLIHNSINAAIVDPGDAEPVLAYLKELDLHLTTILITHHHQDHIGGVNSLIETFPDVKIYAPKFKHFIFKHHESSEGECIILDDLKLDLKVIDLPGHTLDHIAYFHHSALTGSLLFCGDTLFGAGCGRLFEGTPEQMLASLEKLAALPPETAIYCAHEYTLHNINFALTLEPNNPELLERKQATIALRNEQRPSLPSTIALELSTNPFLRYRSLEIKASLGQKDGTDIQVFSATRELKNRY